MDSIDILTICISGLALFGTIIGWFVTYLEAVLKFYRNYFKAFAEPDFLPHERGIARSMASERGEKGAGER